MSVQLIVYPQNYEGFSNSNSLGNNYLVDGLNFNTVNASVDSKISNTGGLYTNLVMNYYDPIIAVNTWYRYHDIASGNVSKIGTVLSLVSTVANPHNGILQRLSNLTIGSVYNVELSTEILIGNASIYFYTGTSFQMGTIVTGASTQTIPFTAVSTEMTIIIGSTYTSISNLLQLNSIKVIVETSVSLWLVSLKTVQSIEKRILFRWETMVFTLNLLLRANQNIQFGSTKEVRYVTIIGRGISL
jgi:hypothetical protein